MRVAIFSATEFEAAPLRRFLTENWTEAEPGFFQKGNAVVHLNTSGIGPVETALFLGKYLTVNDLDLAINIGIAGSLDPNLPLGSVVQVVSERFGDVGVEEADGSFTDLFDLGFWEKDAPPFSNGRLENLGAAVFGFLPKKHGLTVSKAHGSESSIQKIREKFPDAEVESMEGAAFFRACLDAGLPFLEIRAVSNLVEKRNRAAWQIGLAIDNLNAVIIELLSTFTSN